ncbi:hypothetical protein BDR07DRAFT_981768 [Suillus spraguei]|nr:hypothetical protein BDR07DRAFT_981768 [Suillus spraguei]
MTGERPMDYIADTEHVMCMNGLGQKTRSCSSYYLRERLGYSLMECHELLEQHVGCVLDMLVVETGPRKEGHKEYH